MTNANEEMAELEREFYWILFFETSLSSLYRFLQLDSTRFSLTRFSEWVLFPNRIPLDLRRDLYLQIKGRLSHSLYKDYTKLPLIMDEQILHDHTTELLYLKFFGDISSPNRYRHLYNLPPRAIETLLEVYVSNCWIKEETAVSIKNTYECK